MDESNVDQDKGKLPGSLEEMTISLSFFFFLSALAYVEVPCPGIEPIPQQ